METIRRKRGSSAQQVQVFGDTAYIELTRGCVAVIDASDAPKVSKHMWLTDTTGYASTSITTKDGRKRVRLHRFLLDPPSGSEVDHASMDRLDCRRANLRVCSHAENKRNGKGRIAMKGKRVSCAYKGVDACYGKFRAQIKAGGNNRYLGLFPTAEDAARAYDAAAIQGHGEFARVNGAA